MNIPISHIGRDFDRHPPIPYVSLFSGAGGFDLGLEAVGFSPRVCVDVDYHSCRTLRFNRALGRRTGIHGFLSEAVVLEQDLRKVSPQRILRAARLKPGEVPLVIGGPPCQSFSVFGERRGMEDPRGLLWLEFARIIRALRPKAFIFENVAGLLTVNNGSVYSQIFDVLSNTGGEPQYKISAHLLEAANYGVPQFRTRLFIFGSREGIEVPKPEATHTVEWPRTASVNGHLGTQAVRELLSSPTVSDILNCLPPPSAQSWLPNHVGRSHSQTIIDRYRTLRFGQRDQITRVNRLHPERPSYAIIVGSDKGGGKGHVHPHHPREVTARESSRVQTFPDWWWFSGTSKHPIRQVGNAVPPILAAVVGDHAKKHLFGLDEATPHCDMVRNLGLNYLLGSPPGFPWWLKELFQRLSREKDGKCALGLWKAIESYIPSDPDRIDAPVIEQVAD